MSEHTKTPWEQHQDMTDSVIQSSDGRIIADVYGTFVGEIEGQANARHIVHCVNNHERLVEALGQAGRVMTDGNEMKRKLAAKGIESILSSLEAEKGGEL